MTNLEPQSSRPWRRILALVWAGLLFALGVGSVIRLGMPSQIWPLLPAAGGLIFVLDVLSVRDRARQPLSLAGLVLIAVALIDPAAAVLLGLLSGLLIKPPRLWNTWRGLISRRLLESGVRALAPALLIDWTASLAPFGRDFWLVVGYVLLVQGARLVFTLLWEPQWPRADGLGRWLLPNLLIEVLPAPLGILGARISQEFEWPFMVLAAAGLIGTAIAVRRSVRSFGQQRRTMAELGQINEISRAIIRAELDVDALCNLIYAEASKVVDTRNFRLGLFKGRQFELKVRVQEGERGPPLTVTLPDDGGLVGWMRRSGRSLLVHDFAREMDELPARPTYQADQPPRSGIYIPLLTGDDVIGTISIQSLEPNAFDTEDLRILSLIADQAAIAIDKARAYADARLRAAQLATISEVSRQVIAILDLDRLLPSIVHRIRASFGYYHVNIYTLDSQTEELVFRASTNPNSPFWRNQGERLPPGIGIVGYVVQSGEPLLVNDVREEPLFIPDQVGTASEMALPLRVGTQMIGVLDVQSDRLNAFDQNDFFVLQTLADQIAIAIDSANIFTAQKEEAWVLNALLQTAENIAWTSDLSELFDAAMRLPGLLIGAQRVLCLIWNREEHCWSLVATWGADCRQDGHVHKAHDELLEQLALIRNEGEALELTVEQTNELVAAHVIPVCEYGALLALPLTSRAITLGVLLLDRPVDAGWHPRQITIATGLANQMAAALESTLLAQAEAERQHLEQEITVARELQTSLLPSCLPVIENWDTAALWRSARQVGGDFYDFLQFANHRGPNRLGLMIADVSDKGVPAALFMALSRSLVRAAALDGSSPALALEKANRWIVRDSQSYMFVTIFYAILEPETGRLVYSCAGHNPPMLYRAASGTIEQLRTPGIALGVLDEVTLAEAETIILPGDILLCYTDGVTEAVNDAMEEWGVERLTATIVQYADAPMEGLLSAISSSLADHAGERPPFDDVTLLAIKRS